MIRIYNPNPPSNVPVDASTIFTPVVIAQGANTGTTTPPTTILTILNNTLAGGTTGTPYTQQMQASGGKPAYQWYAFGGGTPTTQVATFYGLPNGLSLDVNTGLLSGTPAQSGTFYFTIQVSDSAANSVYRNFSMTVAPGPLSITTPSPLPQGFQYSYYSQPIGVKGGSGNFTFAITSGALPSGITLNTSTGLISGSTNVTGTYKFTVQVTDNVTLKTVKMSYSLYIAFNFG